MAGRVENLKPWPKGVSANPGGRPKKDLAKEIAQAVFENNAEAIYRAMLKGLKKGTQEYSPCWPNGLMAKFRREQKMRTGNQSCT